MGPTQQELQTSYDEVRLIGEKLRPRIEFVESKAMQLGVSYVVFQMLVLSSVSRSPTMSCSQRWIPLWSSTLVAALFGLVFAPVIREWLEMQFEHDVNLLEQHMIHHRMWLSDQGMTPGDEMVVRPDMFRAYKRRASMCLLVFALITYTLVVLCGSNSILCHATIGSKT